MEYKKYIHQAAFLLVVVGALNWGLIGLLKWNLVNLLVGSWPTVEMIIYVLVGVSGFYLLLTHMGDCKVCGKK